MSQLKVNYVLMNVTQQLEITEIVTHTHTHIYHNYKILNYIQYCYLLQQ